MPEGPVYHCGKFVRSLSSLGIFSVVALSLAATAARQESLEQAGDGEKVPPGTMILLEGGTFAMGTPSEEARGPFGLSAPSRKVSVRGFYIGKYPVTVQEFCEFLNDRGNPDGKYLYMFAPGTSDRIVLTREGHYRPRKDDMRDFAAVDVTWLGATEYCRWQSGRTGRQYRLLSETEWEYAARGKEGRKYPWGNEDPVSEAERHREAASSGFGLTPIGAASRVGSFPRSDTPEGVSDMLSWRWEWCSGAYPLDSQELRKAQSGQIIQFPSPCYGREDSSTPWRILRGFGLVGLWDGIWHTTYTAIPAWTRWACPPGTANIQIGFRVAADVGVAAE